MRKTLLTLLIALTYQVSFAHANLSSHIDERVELATIFCRENGFIDNKENSISYQPYVKAVDDYFSHKKRDLAIISLQLLDLMPFSHDNYEAIVGDALSWKIEDGKVSASIDAEHKSILQKKLSPEEYQRFIAWVNQFYQITAFNHFYKNQTALYSKAEKVYNESVLANYQPKIFRDLYGTTTKDITVYISLLNGTTNCSVPEKKAVIMGGLGSSYSPTWENKLCVAYMGETKMLYPFLCKISDVYLYQDVAPLDQKMKEFTTQYYKLSVLLFDLSYHNTNDIFFEQISNLGALLYIEQTNNNEVSNFMMLQKEEGFMWQNEMWEHLSKFKEDRKTYPHYQDYFGKLINRYRYILNNRYH